jgi:hypothetical protein
MWGQGTQKAKKMLKWNERSQQVVENKGAHVVRFAKTNSFWSGKSALFWQETALFGL